MPRELPSAEIAVFLKAHPDIERAISPLSVGGEVIFGTVAIPENGLAVQDGSRYVLVWQDALGRWRFIDLTGSTQFAELVQNKPPFVSPDSSLIDNLWDDLGRFGEGAASALKVLTVVVGIVVVLFVITELQNFKGAAS